MTVSTENASSSLHWTHRIALVAVGSVLLSLLATAVYLRPDPHGLGTHQQLGFPPCSFRVFFGIRCPACGMTTSWAHMVRGQVLSACQSNVGGTLLALAAMLAGPWALVSGLRGRWLWRPRSDWLLIWLVLGILLITMLDWAGRMIVARWS